ncbi:MAG: Smr/MutS family protein [Erysipelotrichaceae bacterium]|nr:Smr/MutS family protein [Erysipelotrichaceae bacterium]
MNKYDAIDLLKVKEKVTEYCAIEDAKEYILNEEVNFNPLLITNKLALTSEALDLLKKNFSLSFDGIQNLNDLFSKADKDIVLSGYELARILTFHNHCQRIKKKVLSAEGELKIKDFADSIYVNDDLAKRIERVVDNSGNIKEDASERLKEIFSNIDQNNSQIKKASDNFLVRYAGSLQESNVFMRNDRVAFLLKNSDKNKFHGYQYGSSASGQATYVEPEEFIELNNRRSTLENDKMAEVHRLLKELTYLVSRYADSYRLNFDSLMQLDVIFAKAEYGYYSSGVMAKINKDGSLYLKDIIHPLIDSKTAVCNTYTLNNPYQGIVISGTNTGGKTVGLKIIGLSVLMSYLGIPLLCEEADIPLFENIYIDIDDNQSISNALSTFSAHISNINNILNNANRESLILIDELISGTDPKEAQAISLAILEKILMLGSTFVITTHYDDIKQFAYNHDNILLSSVGFDLENLKPTYKYYENSVGVSNAIDIASRYVDDESIILNARKYLDSNKSREDELLEKLALEIRENEELKADLEKEILDSHNLKEELEKKIKDFEAEKEALREKYLKQLNDYIEDVKEKANEKLEKLSDVKEEKKFFEAMEELKEEEEELPQAVTFNVGDYVKVGAANQLGEIVSIDGEKVSVSMNGLIVKTKLDNLTKMAKPKKQTYKPKARMARVSRELNIVGERVEDGLAILDNYLDNAYGSGLSECKIIHGFGTGQLRKAVREHLKKIRIVKEFGNGDAYDGGSNVTIVKFK